MSIIIGVAILLSAAVGVFVGWRLGTTAVKFPDYQIEASSSAAYADIEKRAMVHARQRRTKMMFGLGLIFPCITYATLIACTPS